MTVSPTPEPEFFEGYLPQLEAAIDRHNECDNWSTFLNVGIAALALCGDGHAQKALDEMGCWQLDSEGRLPA